MFGFFEPTKEDLIRDIKLKYGYYFELLDKAVNGVSFEQYLTIRRAEQAEIDKKNNVNILRL